MPRPAGWPQLVTGCCGAGTCLSLGLGLPISETTRTGLFDEPGVMETHSSAAPAACYGPGDDIQPSFLHAPVTFWCCTLTAAQTPATPIPAPPFRGSRDRFPGGCWQCLVSELNRFISIKHLAEWLAQSRALYANCP